MYKAPEAAAENEAEEAQPPQPLRRRNPRRRVDGAYASAQRELDSTKRGAPLKRFGVDRRQVEFI